MKLIGFLRGSGKVGSIVVKTVNGQPIASEYQPQVSNPNTGSQVNQRARLKLMSQLAAALSAVIVIPRDGNVSARNGFISRNMKYSYALNGNAQVTYENLQITAGNTALPTIAASRDADQLTINLATSPGASVNRVVYCIFLRSGDNKLQLVTTRVQSDAGQDGKYAVTMPDIEGDLILYAYGMKDVTAQAQAAYGEMSIASGEDVARLVSTRSISMTDYQFTQTRGTTLAHDEAETSQVGANQARVYVTANGNGTVSGAGIFNLGENVTVTATPAQGSTFRGWYVNGQQAPISTSASYTFALTGLTDLVAEFYTPDPDNGME